MVPQLIKPGRIEIFPNLSLIKITKCSVMTKLLNIITDLEKIESLLGV